MPYVIYRAHKLILQLCQNHAIFDGKIRDISRFTGLDLKDFH